MSKYVTTPIPAAKPPVKFVERPWGSFRQYAHNEPVTVSLEHAPLNGPDPALVALEHPAAEELRERCLALLGSPEDRALYMLMSEGMTQLGMAQRLGLTQQRISQRVFRNRCHLEDRL